MFDQNNYYRRGEARERGEGPAFSRGGAVETVTRCIFWTVAGRVGRVRGLRTGALGLHGGKDAVERGLHANHLALHDLGRDYPHEISLKSKNTYQVLPLEAR
jgi:hypothetical protein